MTINSIAAQPDRVGRHAVRFDDGSVLRLYRQTIEEFGLYPGLELTDDQMDKVRIAACSMSAKMRAVRIVAATNVSKKDLESRLVRKGETPTDAQNAVQWMSDLQLLDDKKTAEQIVGRCINKGYGITRAKQALFEKRIPKEYWNDVLEDYPDQADVIFSFVQSHIADPSDQKQVKRTIDALIRRGHNYAQIRHALERLSIETEGFVED